MPVKTNSFSTTSLQNTVQMVNNYIKHNYIKKDDILEYKTEKNSLGYTILISHWITDDISEQIDKNGIDTNEILSEIENKLDTFKGKIVEDINAIIKNVGINSKIRAY